MSQREKVAIQSRDGASSRITIFRNSDREAPVLVLMPAMGVKATFYEPLAHALVREGLNLVTADLRGHGESRIRPGRDADFGYGEMVRYDWPCIIDRTRILFPHSRKILLGHSLGGQLSTLYMSENPGEIDGLITVGAPSLYYLDWPFPGSITLLFSTQLFRLVAKVMGYFPGRRMGIGGTEAKSLVRDWARVVRKGRYDMINPSRDYEPLLRNLRVPVLAISFTDDGFAPKRAIDRLYSKMTHIDLTRWHITPQEMGCDELGHFWWVNQSDRLAGMISNWLATVL